MIATASQIKDYNYKSYFVRRATEDKAQMDSFSVEDIQERLDQMHRIHAVQNVYAREASIVETKQAPTKWLMDIITRLPSF